MPKPIIYGTCSECLKVERVVVSKKFNSLLCMKHYRYQLCKIWSAENKAHLRDLQKKWANKNPEKTKERYRKHNKKRYYISLAYNRYRKYLKLKATPKWLTKEQKVLLRQFYENKPLGVHVDHIVPLNGKTVCGLNVPWNLQYLLAFHNMEKSNKL